MPDPSPLAAFKLPADLLALLASRGLHDALQPLHHLIRLLHVLSAGALFGAVGMLDLRMLSGRGVVSLGQLARQAHPWLAAAFGAAMASGVVLFAYDPIRVGSHAYFAPKLALLALALGNSLVLHRVGAGKLPPIPARIAGGVSLAAWIGVMACASLNREAAPRVPNW